MSLLNSQERLIRYPAAQLYEEEEETFTSVDTIDRTSDWWGVERYYDLSSDEEDEAEGRAFSQQAASTSGRGLQRNFRQVD